MGRIGVWLVVFAVAVAALVLGAMLRFAAPAPVAIGPPPADLPLVPVAIDSKSGSRLSGWLLRGQPSRGAVLLMHGVRANRLAMLERARLLHRHAFSVLLFDFQAHGESPGQHITFGYLEARDARAAFDYLRGALPNERIGIIGTSLGGVAAVLADPPIAADAMVLEAVYASLPVAIANRLAIRLGAAGRLLTPIFLWQIKQRLGFDARLLQPARRISSLYAPLLLLAGAADQRATLAEINELYARANAPKELWVIAGAAHVDFGAFAPSEYERRVIGFLEARLSTRGNPALAPN